MYIFLTIFLLVILFFVIFFYFRKKRIVEKVCLLSSQEKCSLLDDICYPLGYDFNCGQGIFSTLHDAWQKEFGYTYSYDRFAPFAGMVFDAQPVYFDYNGRTWLIEFWKGQYGITSGCEIGIYHADGLVPEVDRKKTLFKAVDEHEMLDMSFSLRNDESALVSLSETHWWLTAFCLGIFNRPRNLCMDITLTFPNCDMLSSFIHAMLDLGYSSQNMKVSGQSLSFSFITPYANKCNFLRRIIRRISLWNCKILCKLFNYITRPFTKSDEQLLYLYFYLPFAFRHILLLHSRNHKNRRQQKKLYRAARKKSSK